VRESHVAPDAVSVSSRAPRWDRQALRATFNRATRSNALCLVTQPAKPGGVTNIARLMPEHLQQQRLKSHTLALAQMMCESFEYLVAMRTHAVRRMSPGCRKHQRDSAPVRVGRFPDERAVDQTRDRAHGRRMGKIDHRAQLFDGAARVHADRVEDRAAGRSGGVGFIDACGHIVDDQERQHSRQIFRTFGDVPPNMCSMHIGHAAHVEAGCQGIVVAVWNCYAGTGSWQQTPILLPSGSRK
jgi:hypothetical protein